MMMISPRRRAASSRGRLLVAALLLVVFALLVVFRAGAAAAFWRVLSPVMALRNTLGKSEVSRLRAELASTSALLADRNSLATENAILRSQLGRNPAEHMVLAGVLLHAPAVAYDTLLIDAGKVEGIAPGDLVYAGGTTLVGSVSEVYDESARVELLSTPGRTYQAFLRSGNALSAAIPISVEGQGAGSMRAQVPASTNVSRGDQVIFPGVAGDFAGLVSYVDIDASQSFKTLYLTMPVNPQSLEFVEVHI